MYGIEAQSSEQALDQMVEAIVRHAEQTFHVKDVMRKPDARPDEDTLVDLQPASWLASVRRRLDEAEHRLREAHKRYSAKK